MSKLKHKSDWADPDEPAAKRHKPDSDESKSDAKDSSAPKSLGKEDHQQTLEAENAKKLRELPIKKRAHFVFARFSEQGWDWEREGEYVCFSCGAGLPNFPSWEEGECEESCMTASQAEKKGFIIIPPLVVSEEEEEPADEYADGAAMAEAAGVDKAWFAIEVLPCGCRRPRFPFFRLAGKAEWCAAHVKQAEELKLQQEGKAQAAQEQLRLRKAYGKYTIDQQTGLKQWECGCVCDAETGDLERVCKVHA